MKKILFTTIYIFVFTLVSLNGKAQNYTFNPGKTIVGNIIADYNYADFQIDISNETTHKLSLTWTLLSNTITTGWDYSLCDFGTCFVSIPPSHTMDSIPIGGSGFLKINLSPQNIPGTGWIKMLIHETSDTTHIDTLSYMFNAVLTGIGEYEESLHYKVYPNPASNIITLSQNDHSPEIIHVSVYDQAGRLVLSTLSCDRIDVGDLEPGMYTLILKNKEGTSEGKKLIIQ